ncbi:unnamed protein product [Lymnaea stagnalis]|uniref:Uncharacterized protein n=1 Tax=Lymnaea stagnalis TaxID=6523 RepID=A0AAV2ILD2_LYMST
MRCAAVRQSDSVHSDELKGSTSMIRMALNIVWKSLQAVIVVARLSVSSGTSPRNGPGSSMWKFVRITRPSATVAAVRWKRVRCPSPCPRERQRPLYQNRGAVLCGQSDDCIPAHVLTAIVLGCDSIGVHNVRGVGLANTCLPSSDLYWKERFY